MDFVLIKKKDECLLARNLFDDKVEHYVKVAKTDREYMEASKRWNQKTSNCSVKSG